VHVTIGATAGQSPVMSFLLAMALAASLVLIVGIVACAIPSRRILAVEASEAVRSNG
jgi:ABC-type antimicrobial peptide transport system permease subunit